MAKASIEKFLNWATPHAWRQANVLPYEPQISQANQWGYVFGWYGRIATSGKWKGRWCCDCNGLAEWFLNLELGGNHNTASRYNYADWCKGYNGTDMNHMPQVPGTAVFVYGRYGAVKIIHHVGFLWRKYGPGKFDWLVLEAANSDKGVIISKFHSGWNRWGLMVKYFDYDTTVEPVITIPETVKMGSKGDVVKQLQTLLNKRGGYHLEVDGDFGPLTDAVVRRWQTVNKLEVDGIVGPKTWLSLLK